MHGAGLCVSRGQRMFIAFDLCGAHVIAGWFCAMDILGIVDSIRDVSGDGSASGRIWGPKIDSRGWERRSMDRPPTGTTYLPPTLYSPTTQLAPPHLTSYLAYYLPLPPSQHGWFGTLVWLIRIIVVDYLVLVNNIGCNLMDWHICNNNNMYSVTKREPVYAYVFVPYSRWWFLWTLVALLSRKTALYGALAASWRRQHANGGAGSEK